MATYTMTRESYIDAINKKLDWVNEKKLDEPEMYFCFIFESYPVERKRIEVMNHDGIHSDEWSYLNCTRHHARGSAAIKTLELSSFLKRETNRLKNSGVSEVELNDGEIDMINNMNIEKRPYGSLIDDYEYRWIKFCEENILNNKRKKTDSELVAEIKAKWDEEDIKESFADNASSVKPWFFGALILFVLTLVFALM